MNKFRSNYSVKYADAENIMNIHLCELQDYQYSTRQLHARVIGSLLSSLSLNNQKKKLFFGEKPLLRWMVNDVKNKAIKYASSCLQVVDCYLEQLCKHGMLPDNPLRQIKPRYVKPSWDSIATALQSSKPLEQLNSLRPAAPLRGPLHQHIEKYISLQQSVGKKYKKPHRVLSRLDTLLAMHRIRKPAELKTHHIHEWLGQMRCNKDVQLKHISVLKRFVDYLMSVGVVSNNPVISVLQEHGTICQKKFRPLILTEKQIVSIIEESKTLPPNHLFTLRPQVCHTLLTLIYTLGLRNSEARNLRFCDVDMRKNTLYIEATKFYKSRLLPFGPHVCRCLQKYISVRRKLFSPVKDDDPLFVTYRRYPISESVLCTVLKLLAKRMLPPSSQLPRVHDLRHNFAVHRLLKWYQNDDDVQSKLILLSTFMGHAEISSTEVYLTITLDLLKEANNRFYRHCGKDLQL